ncbi:MAG: hypothetical protein IJ837_02780 [Clostridia bacterium]|nr:hypothetical protein [Clostridia bacterium]
MENNKKQNDNIMIISIQSYYARQIFNGTKIYEFRKSPIKQNDLNKKIYVYSAKEDKSIIGTIKVEKFLRGDLNYILQETGYINRSDKNEIIDYFGNNKNCYALKLYDIEPFLTPIKLKELRKIDSNISFPQYYGYMKKNSQIVQYILKKEKENKIKEISSKQHNSKNEKFSI